MKKVAIDIRSLSSGHAVRGIGVMVRELVASVGKVAEGVDFSTADLSNYDVLHYPYFHPYFYTVPEKSDKRVVVTIQDLIQLIYPDKYPAGIRGRWRFRQQRMRLADVDRIVTITETSKKDIVRFMNIPAGKIDVVYLAPKKVFKPIRDKKRLAEVTKRYNLPKKFVLYVGDVNYNKNVVTLIDACKKAGMVLVIVGKHAKEIEEAGFNLGSLSGPRDWIRFLTNKQHPEISHFEKLQDRFRGNGEILRLGFVADEDLAVIYNLASVYCQPSLYEGFGLPPLEAMACGTAVVCSRTQALVEVCGDGAEYFDPLDMDGLSDKLLSAKQGKKGLEWVKRYSWDRVAREMMEVYERESK